MLFVICVYIELVCVLMAQALTIWCVAAYPLFRLTNADWHSSMTCLFLLHVGRACLQMLIRVVLSPACVALGSDLMIA